MKHLLIILAIILSLGLAYAQTTLGVKAGLNISHISGDDAMASSDPSVGLHAGAMIQHYLLPSLILQPELLYTQKGHSYKYNISDVYTTHTVSLDYLELPMVLKLNYQAGNVRIQPYAGASVAYLINAKDKQKVSAGNTSTTTNHDIGNSINDIGAGIIVGAETVISQRYTVGVRYVLGLTEIYKNGNDTTNAVIMLNVGYLFNSTK